MAQSGYSPSRSVRITIEPADADKLVVLVGGQQAFAFEIEAIGSFSPFADEAIDKKIALVAGVARKGSDVGLMYEDWDYLDRLRH